MGVKLGIMGGSLYGKTTKESIINLIKEVLAYKNYQFVLGPNETGILKEVKDILFSAQKEVIVVGIAGKASFYQARGSGKIEVSSIFDRIHKLYEESDAILFFPGGFGTRAEFYAMLDQKIEMSDKKPLILYHENDEFSPLLDDLKEMKMAGYVSETIHLEDYFDEVTTYNDFIQLLKKYERDGVLNG